MAMSSDTAGLTVAGEKAEQDGTERAIRGGTPTTTAGTVSVCDGEIPCWSGVNAVMFMGWEAFGFILLVIEGVPGVLACEVSRLAFLLGTWTAASFENGIIGSVFLYYYPSNFPSA